MSWKSTCNPTCSNMFDIQEELKRVPEVPGVYIMKNKNKEVIYVGKAISNQTSIFGMLAASLGTISCVEKLRNNKKRLFAVQS